MDNLENISNGIAAGALENLGLGRITPFVKLGLDSMNANSRELEEDVVTVLSLFENNFLISASKMPPLGNFQSPSEDVTPLSPSRLTEILQEFNGLIGRSGGPNTSGGFDGLRRVFGAVNLLHGTFNDHKQYSKQAAGSIYSNLRM